MDIPASPILETEDPRLPPLHTIRPFVQPEDHLPYVARLQPKWDLTLIPQPEFWWPEGSIPPAYDNLQPLLGPAIGAGALFGIWTGATRGAARFTAENAHRKPRTLKGWFYYKRSKNYNVFMGAVRASGKYSFRFSALVTSYSLLSTFFSQSFAKAKSWRDEDRLARCLVRNYDGLGNSRTPEEEKIREEELKKAAVGMLWPNEDGFEPWDWVGAVGSGAASGGILCAGMGFYRHWYPPTIVVPSLLAMLGGGIQGASNLYAARERQRKRELRAVVEAIDDRETLERESEARWKEVERMNHQKKEDRLKELRVGEKKEKGDWVGWALAKLGGK